MSQETTTTEASIDVPVTGTTAFGAAGLANPTPVWAKRIVRALTWITGIWAVVGLQIDLSDFGVSDKAEILILKYMAVLSFLASLAARFTGIKPPDLSMLNRNEYKPH